MTEIQNAAAAPAENADHEAAIRACVRAFYEPRPRR